MASAGGKRALGDCTCHIVDPQILPKKWCFKGKQHLFYNNIGYLIQFYKKGTSYKIKDGTIWEIICLEISPNFKFSVFIALKVVL